MTKATAVTEIVFDRMVGDVFMSNLDEDGLIYYDRMGKVSGIKRNKENYLFIDESNKLISLDKEDALKLFKDIPTNDDQNLRSMLTKPISTTASTSSNTTLKVVFDKNHIRKKISKTAMDKIREIAKTKSPILAMRACCNLLGLEYDSIIEQEDQILLNTTPNTVVFNKKSSRFNWAVKK